MEKLFNVGVKHDRSFFLSEIVHLGSPILLMDFDGMPLSVSFGMLTPDPTGEIIFSPHFFDLDRFLILLHMLFVPSS
jgi:hypothetical protein